MGGSLGDLNSANRYTYADDDPVNEVDPRGTAVTPGCIADFIASTAALAYASIQDFPALIALYDVIIAGNVIDPIVGAALLATLGLA